MPNILHTSLAVKGLSQKTVLFHLTDAHLTLCESEPPEIEKAAAERGAMFSHYAGQPTSEAFLGLLAAGDAFKPDMFVLTGDIIDFPTKANLAFFEYAMKDRPYMFTPGNHDWSYLFRSETKELQAENIEKLAPFMPSLAHSRILNGVRLFFIDTSLYQVTEDSLAKLEKELAAPEPCLLFCHIPLFIKEMHPAVAAVWQSSIVVGSPPEYLDFSRAKDKAIAPTETTLAFHKLVAAHPRIAGVVAGHLHFSCEHALASGQPQIVTGAGYNHTARVITLNPA